MYDLLQAQPRHMQTPGVQHPPAHLRLVSDVNREVDLLCQEGSALLRPQPCHDLPLVEEELACGLVCVGWGGVG